MSSTTQNDQPIVHRTINPRIATDAHGRRHKKMLVSHVQITPMHPKAGDIINIGMIFSLQAIRGAVREYELRCEVLEGPGPCPVPTGRFDVNERGQLKHAGGNHIHAVPGLYRISIFTWPFDQPSWETILRVAAR